jgi:PTS system galactitol-specific IIB component
MQTITLLVACGSGIATASLAETRLREEFKRRGVPVRTFKCKSLDVRSFMDQYRPDIVVTTAVIKQENLSSDTPVFTGVPILYGDPTEVYDQIFEAVEKILSQNAHPR